MTAERFSIQIPEDVLIDLKYRLDHIRWPDQLENVAWERGTEKGYLQSLYHIGENSMIGERKKPN